MSQQPPTKYAPAARSDRDQLARQSAQVADQPLVKELFAAFSNIALVLNPQRQVVYANPVLFDTLGIEPGVLLGLRPGELVHCIHAGTEPGGCGTAEACRYCGAVNAVLACQERREKTSKECRIVTLQAEGQEVPLDLKVTATPLRLGAVEYTIVELADISDTKRRQALERIFFHDVLNKAWVVGGYLQYLREKGTTPEEIGKILPRVERSMQHLTDDILMQRQLSQAEHGDLVVQPEPLALCGAIATVAEEYRAHPLAEQRTIAADAAGVRAAIVTDPGLLNRVLGNLLKNALEATPAGGTVTIGCREDAAGAAVTVRNPGAMSDEVKSQIFQRSFSTKGLDRGLGTYSVKLLVERYLGGKVEFSSDAAAGTAFTVTLPPAITGKPEPKPN